MDKANKTTSRPNSPRLSSSYGSFKNKLTQQETAGQPLRPRRRQRRLAVAPAAGPSMDQEETKYDNNDDDDVVDNHNDDNHNHSDNHDDVVPQDDQVHLRRFDVKSDLRFRQPPPSASFDTTLTTRGLLGQEDPRFRRLFQDAAFQFTSSPKGMQNLSTAPVDPYGRKRTTKTITTRHPPRVLLTNTQTNNQPSKTTPDHQKPSKTTKTTTMTTTTTTIPTVQGGLSHQETTTTLQPSDSSTDDAYLSSSSSISDEDEEVEPWNVAWENQESQAQKSTSVSRRFAVMGCEWDNIRAVDLLVVCASVLMEKKDGMLKDTPIPGVERVSIYPSQYGMVQMDREAVSGPAIEPPPVQGLASDESLENPKTEDMEKVRLYQRNRSRYFYGVVCCENDSVATQLYDELDGMDTDFSIDTIDLRFIPDDMQIPFAPVCEATTIPASYEPADVFRSALRHSKVECTWDQTPKSRSKMLMRKFSEKELNDMDLEAYLGSSDDEGETEEGEKEPTKGGTSERRQNAEILGGDAYRYRQTLLGVEADETSGEEEGNVRDIAKNSRPSQDVEIIFAQRNPPTTDKSYEASTSSGQAGNSWAKYLERQKLKKKEARIKIRRSQRPAGQEEADSQLMLKKTNKFPSLLRTADPLKPLPPLSKSPPSPSLEEQDRHFNMRPTKGKRKPKNKQDDTFEVDCHDPRLAVLFTNPNFAIDPTHASFKNTTGNQRLLEEKRAQKMRNIT